METGEEFDVASRRRLERVKQRLRQSLVRGEILDLDNDTGELFSAGNDAVETFDGEITST
jgi:hypothetical protein